MICCCTGHRPKGFPFPYGDDSAADRAYRQALRQSAVDAFTSCGVTHFISGMAMGVDMDFADIVLQLRDEYIYPVILECALPCMDQTAQWQARDRARYDAIVQRADIVTYTGDAYTADCLLRRNRYMVDKSDLVIAVYNGMRRGGTWYTIGYAQKRRVPIVMIDLNKIDAARAVALPQ